MVAATGIGSGLDIESLVTQLVAAEGAPAEARLVRREAQLTSQLSAFGSLQGSLSNIQTSLTTLSNLSTFSQRSSSSSNSAALGISASSSAASGSYSVQIDQLAQTQSLASGSFTDLTDVVGEGELTFRFGTATLTPPEGETQTFDAFSVNPERDTATITIDSANNTLEGLRDAVNEADIGVSAAIVNDGSGFRLLFSSTETGAENAIEIQVNDTGDANSTDENGLSRLAFNTGANNLSQTTAALDANFTINGLNITSAGNSVSDVIDGVDLTLRETTESPVDISVAENTGAARSAIESFVNTFNSFVGVANNLTAYNAGSDSAGPLQGDFSARSIISQVRSAITGTASGFGGAFNSLSELGVRTESDGTLSIDNAVLSSAIEDNFDDIAGVFAELGVVSDGGVEFIGSSEATQVGSYDVEITQIATQGLLEAAAITAPSALSPLVIDADNDSFTISVNGTSSGTISLTQGDYESGEALAAEIQSRINGDTDLQASGASVTVAFSADNRLILTSETFGSESEISIESIDTNSASSLGLSVAAGVAGQDVQGLIGGIEATGVGQILRAAEGSASAGMSLLITGGDLGSRGSVDFSSGIAVALSSVISGFLGSDGLISLRTDGIQDGVDRIAEDQEALDRRLESLEARYRRQFNALDGLLANLQSTGDFLLTALDNLPGSNQNRDN
ncbi:MAG: flagellar filament capping protein FliD [Congregibacter sp.]